MTAPSEARVRREDKERAQAVWDAFDLTCTQCEELARSFARHRQSAQSDLIAALREAGEALDLFARLELPSSPCGNAGFYSIPFVRIETARAALATITATLAKHGG